MKNNGDLLVLTRPDVIRDIHEGYLAVGVDIIETNTFGANSIAQDDYALGHLAREMNVAAARLAREAADKFSTPESPRFVAGALGPTPRTASISPDVNDPGARNVDFEHGGPSTRQLKAWRRRGDLRWWKPSSTRSCKARCRSENTSPPARAAA